MVGASWTVAARNFTALEEEVDSSAVPTKELAAAAAAPTVNPSIPSGRNTLSRDSQDQSQSVAKKLGRKRSKIPVLGKQPW